MEANKEEAVRAKDIAVKKLEGKYFITARKFALKAQNLFPDLENVSQILTVCDVCCSGGIKLNGLADWYGILKVEPTADDMTIRKQYKNLALLLHPDKNKLPGAEAAFKLVLEAKRILLDQTKRSVYDTKIGVDFRNVSSTQFAQQSKMTSGTSMLGVSSNTVNVSSTRFNGSYQQQRPPFSSVQTFWMICPFCGVRYQYYQRVLKKAIRCQSCMKIFIDHDLSVQAVPSWASSGFSANHTVPQQDIQDQGFQGPGADMDGQKSYFGYATGMGCQRKAGVESVSLQPWSVSGSSTEGCKKDSEFQAVNEVKCEQVKLQELNKREQTMKSSVGNARGKRSRKIVVDSSNSKCSYSDVVIEKNSLAAGRNVGTDSINPQRAARQNENISYHKGDVNNEIFTSSIGRSEKGEILYNYNHCGQTCSEGPSNWVGKRANKNDKVDKQEGVPSEEKVPIELQGKAQLNVDSYKDSRNAVGSVAIPSAPLYIFYPESEFLDFGIERGADKFEINQIWSVYDSLDGMPRLYALIRDVDGPDFKLYITWLEHVPDSKGEVEWSKKEMPVACGNYRLGKSGYTTDHLMFSHCMTWRKGKKRNSYMIYPMKGEVWALFKDWDIGWSSDADKHKVFEYVIVEILSDYAEDAEVDVIHLVKINGFISLFKPSVDMDIVRRKIPPSEILRFSHRVPSYRMTGEEREGIPVGSFELDSASLPSNLADTYPSASLESIKARVGNLGNADDGLCSRTSGQEKLAAGTTKMNSFHLNEEKVMLDKNVCESQTSKDPVSTRSNEACKEEHIQAYSGQHSSLKAGKHVETDRVLRPQVNAKEGAYEAGKTNTNDANERNDSLISSLRLTYHDYNYPDSEFHNFEGARLKVKFVRGQIWALYSDVDTYPKYYGLIRNVERRTFKVIFAWLAPCPVREEEKRWLQDLPISCGTFKITSEESVFDASDIFSHLVQAVPAGRKGYYDIYPNSGEVWALYKNWSIGWSLSDLQEAEYSLVEILSHSDSGIKVLMLAQVDGYAAVFMPERKGLAASTMEIPVDEYVRFSHRIPAFRLTQESGGKLRGYWELDPLSMPLALLVREL